MNSKEESIKNYYKKSPDLLGDKELVVYDGTQEVKVTIENDMVVNVESNATAGDYNIDEINSQLESGATLGEALNGGIDVLKENGARKRIGYWLDVTNGKQKQLPTGTSPFFLFRDYDNHEALELAIEHGRKYNLKVQELFRTNHKLSKGEYIWPEQSQVKESTKAVKGNFNLQSLIRECIHEVLSELR